MAKRFGRNQKRRLIREVNIARNQAAHGEIARAQLRDLVSALGYAHYALPVVQYFHTTELPPQWRMLAVERPSFETYKTAVRNMDQKSVLHLAGLLCRVEEEQPSQARHIRVNGPNGQAGYYLSSDLIHKLPPEQLAQQIARELTSIIVDQLRG